MATIAETSSDAALKNTITTAGSKSRKRRWRRRKHRLLSDATNPNVLFSLTLAALARPQNPSSKTLIKQCTTKFLQFPLPGSQSLLNPIVSLLPLLLRCRSYIIACGGARIVGVAALVSIGVNEKIASDDEILNALMVKIVRSEKREVMTAVCNAVLDLSTTSFGRRRLVELSGLHYLMLGFLQLQKSLKSSISIKVVENKGDPFLGVEHREDELPLLLLDTIVTLTNFCNTGQLKRIPRMLVEPLLTYLKEVWSKVRDSKFLNFYKGRCCYLSSLTSYTLAECIFRLSLDTLSTSCCIPSEITNRHLFGPSKSSFKNFMSEHWELSPFLMRKPPKGLDMSHDIFSSFTHSLTCEGTISRFLSSLQGMVSCPPVALNEIDIMSFLGDVRNTLGCPVTYQQDIRVVRTNLHSNSEEHYFQGCSSSGIEAVRSFSIDDILKCEAAYKEGYTIALRGMEFRVKSIADITREIASRFGQPSVGANLYVTPPNSQGLACHFDDHCVFVCQLRGTKQWHIFPQPIVQLPRLYEQLEVPLDLMVESGHISLREGDVLYIPRGFAHEARTVVGVNASGNASEFSIHLTLAVEVEPPFEWEGFAHVALHQWSHEMESDNFPPGLSGSLQAILVSILHASIRLISDAEPGFRKACLAAATSLCSGTEEWLDKNQRVIFNQLVSEIFELASFTDSLKFIELAIQRNEDPFHWLRWLEHLNGGKVLALDIWNFTSDQFCMILPSITERKDDAEAAFAHLKSKFCSEVLFDDAKESFKILHALYKECRMQYMNGMLSLHY